MVGLPTGMGPGREGDDHQLAGRIDVDHLPEDADGAVGAILPHPPLIAIADIGPGGGRLEMKGRGILHPALGST
jgi:hypothetical protein